MALVFEPEQQTIRTCINSNFVLIVYVPDPLYTKLQLHILQFQRTVQIMYSIWTMTDCPATEAIRDNWIVVFITVDNKRYICRTRVGTHCIDGGIIRAHDNNIIKKKRFSLPANYPNTFTNISVIYESGRYLFLQRNEPHQWKLKRAVRRITGYECRIGTVGNGSRLRWLLQVARVFFFFFLI